MLHRLQALPQGQARKGKDEAGRRVREGGFDGGAILLAPQTDNDRIAIQLLLPHLLAKSIKRDGAGGRVLEADLVGIGDAEVRCDEAVRGAEDDPDTSVHSTPSLSRRGRADDDARFAHDHLNRLIDVEGLGRGHPIADGLPHPLIPLLVDRHTLADPIGMTVQIGGFPFEIIGVLEDDEFRSQTRKALAIDDRAQDVYVPYSTSMRTFGTLTYIESGGSADRSIVELDQMIVVAKSAELVYPTARMLERLLDQLHAKQDYEIVVPLELLEQRNKTQQVFDIVMVLIAAISLVVGGIGIANIMLATITERTKEIGVRRALGARRRDILLQFLTETAAIGAIGGLLGCLLGLGAIEALQRFSGWRALIDPAYFAVSLAISCAVAVLSGVYPARRASRMDPITALRYE